jgi:hypothetical protein
MEIDARAHVFYRVANAPLLSYPFPHFYVESVFPEAYYRSLLDALPPLASYMPLSETGTVTAGSYKERFCLDLLRLDATKQPPPQAAFWRDMAQWMGSGELTNLLLTKFQAAATERFGANKLHIQLDMRLFRDFTNYAIGPHTDTPRKLMSLLFYLPRDDSMRHLGTSVYEPLDPAFTCEGTQHHQFEDFRKLYTAPFRPNSLFGFFKTSRAFHGVERVVEADLERDTLQYNIYINKLVRTVPPKPALRWPWSSA